MRFGTKPLPPPRPGIGAFGARFGAIPLGALLAGCLLPALAFAHPAAPAPGTDHRDSRAAAVADCNDAAACGGLGCCLLHALAIGAPAAPDGEAGLRVEWDPESGRFGMPAAPVLDLFAGPEAAMLSRESDDLVPVTLPGGAMLLNLRGRFQSLSLASRLPDGSIRTGCEDSELGVLQWLRASASAKNPAGWPEE